MISAVSTALFANHWLTLSVNPPKDLVPTNFARYSLVGYLHEKNAAEDATRNQPVALERVWAS